MSPKREVILILWIILSLVDKSEGKKRDFVEQRTPGVRCVNLNFVNSYGKPFKIWKQISNTKFKGFIVTGRDYKLKTIVSEEHSDSPVRYHAVPLDENNDVKLHISGQDTISVMPFDCDDSFVELVVTPSGQSTSRTNSGSLSSRTLLKSDPEESSEACTQAVGGTILGHHCCRFPFLYQNKLITKCTDEDSPGMRWCATSANYDLDKQWGYCVRS